MEENKFYKVARFNNYVNRYDYYYFKNAKSALAWIKNESDNRIKYYTIKQKGQDRIDVEDGSWPTVEDIERYENQLRICNMYCYDFSFIACYFED